MIIEKPKVSPSGRYTLLQAAKALELSKSTIYRMIGGGKIKATHRQSDNKQVIAGTEILRVWQQTW